MNPKIFSSIDELDNLVGLKTKDRSDMEIVTQTFPFRANEYYLSLIDWKDRHDPLRRIVVPDPRELKGGGCKDTACGKELTKFPGLRHKDAHTGLLLLSDVCDGICRFCFRKRLVVGEEPETVRDITDGLDYVRSHPEITSVLLTGGDPFTLETNRLEAILHELREIEHVAIIRIGTKMPAYNPYRFLNDPHLTEVLSRYSSPEKQIYILAHYNHPREMTDVSMQAIGQLHRSGVIVVNQTPVLNEVNSDPFVLTQLFRKLSAAGVSPYYVFQCRPSIGNQLFQTPVEQSYEILQQTWQMCSDLVRRARFVMSHATGRIEVVGKTAQHIFMRYHSAANRDSIGKFLIFRSDPAAFWFDDYQHLLSDFIPKTSWLF